MDLRFARLPLVFPPSSFCPGGREEHGSQPGHVATAKRNGVSLPSPGPGEEGKLLSPLEWLVAGQGRDITSANNSGSRSGASNGSRKNEVFPTLSREHHLSAPKPPMALY